MSSPMILSFSTVFALIGIVLAAIAFGTNNWQTITVDRTSIFTRMETNAALKTNLTRGNQVNSSYLYFDRNYGLFRECYPNELPGGSETYRSPLGSRCKTRTDDYQVPENKDVTKTWNKDQLTRMHLMRTTIAFYIVGLAFLFFTLFTGICGCWRRHSGLILTTGILLLFATLFLAASMAVWHGVDYLTREVIRVYPYEQAWPQWLMADTSINYGWSYVVSWAAVAMILVSSLLMLGAYRSMKEEEADEMEKKAAPYMMASYYDKSQLMPYGYGNSYPGYGYPAAAGYYGQGYGQQGYGGQQQYGYMTYSR